MASPFIHDCIAMNPCHYNARSCEKTNGAIISSRFHAAEITPNIIMYSSQISTARKYILEDIAGAFFYSSVPLACDDIIKIPIEPEITSRIGIIWKKGVYVRDSVTRFIEFAKTYQL